MGSLGPAGKYVIMRDRPVSLTIQSLAKVGLNMVH